MNDSRPGSQALVLIIDTIDGRKKDPHRAHRRDEVVGHHGVVTAADRVPCPTAAQPRRAEHQNERQHQTQKADPSARPGVTKQVGRSWRDSVESSCLVLSASTQIQCREPLVSAEQLTSCPDLGRSVSCQVHTRCCGPPIDEPVLLLPSTSNWPGQGVSSAGPKRQRQEHSRHRVKRAYLVHVTHRP